MAMAENTYRQDVNGKKVDGENKFEDLLRLLEKKMIESASEVDSKMMILKFLGGIFQIGQALRQLFLFML